MTGENMVAEIIDIPAARSQASRQFADLLEALPYLKPYWDLDRGECDTKRLKDAVGAWSHGERIMAQFAVAVWSGQNVLEFDFIETASTLDEDNRAVISGWLKRPFWP